MEAATPDLFFLFLTMQGTVLHYQVQCVLTVDFLWMPYIRMAKLPSVPTALHVSVMKECYILSNTFLYLLRYQVNKERLDHAI